MRLLLLAAAALARPEELLERGTSHYNAGDSSKAQQAFVQLSTDKTAPPHLRAQAYQGLAALAQRRGDPVEAAAHVEHAVATCDGGTCDAPLRATFYEARGVLKRGAGDFAGAVDAFTRCASLDADRACDAALARLFHHNGHIQDAPQHYLRAVQAASSRTSCKGEGCVLRVPLLNDAAIALEACLLYTSPSPRDGLLSRMPSSA